MQSADVAIVVFPIGASATPQFIRVVVRSRLAQGRAEIMVNGLHPAANPSVIKTYHTILNTSCFSTLCMKTGSFCSQLSFVHTSKFNAVFQADLGFVQPHPHGRRFPVIVGKALVVEHQEDAEQRQGDQKKPCGLIDHRPRFYRIDKSLTPVMQGTYGDPFLRAVILDRQSARQKPVYPPPLTSRFLVLRHVHPSSLNTDKDRLSQKFMDGGLLSRLRL
jgi:hypothetical protein